MMQSPAGGPVVPGPGPVVPGPGPVVPGPGPGPVLPAERSFSQVVFQEVQPCYPPTSSLCCSYSLPCSFRPSSRDWVGIFKVGWSSTKEYHTFVWVEPVQEGAGLQTGSRQALFKEYYLPKDQVDFYQFCYVDSGGQVRGHSSTFCFSQPEEPEESSGEDDLLVITTQEQVEQSHREREELQKEVQEARGEKEALERSLQEEKQRVCRMEEEKRVMEEEKRGLEEEKRVMEEEKRGMMKQLEESREERNLLQRALEEQEEDQQQTDQKKRSQSLTSDGSTRRIEDKYEQAVLKIRQLKEERENLKACQSVQSDDINRLKARAREDERELSKARDRTHLLEVDLQSLQKEKENLSLELHKLHSLRSSLEELKEENQELSRRLKQNQNQEQNQTQNQTQTQTQPRASDQQLKAVEQQLEECRAQLGVEKEACGSSRRTVEYLEEELTEVKGQLERVVGVLDQEQRKSSKLLLQLREMNEMMADRDIALEEKEVKVTLEQQEKEELTALNQTLRNELEGLRSVYADLQASSPQQEVQQQQQGAEEAQEEESLYQNIEELVGAPQEEEQTLVCGLCEESFPGITPSELEQHQQTHRVCPFCSALCDLMQQDAYEDHVYSHEL